jgi:hypothetical protein
MKTQIKFIFLLVYSLLCQFANGQTHPTISQSNKNGSNIGRDQNNYKINYTVNIVEDKVTKLTSLKGISKSPAIIDKINTKVSQLLDSRSVSQVIQNQESIINILSSIRDLSTTENQDVKQLIISLEKVNSILENGKNSLTINKSNSKNIITGETLATNETAFKAVNDNTIPILKNYNDFQQIYQNKAEIELSPADEAIVSGRIKEGLQLYKEKISAVDDIILKSYMLSHEAELNLPGQEIYIQFKDSKSGGVLKVGDSYNKVKTLCLEAIKYYSYNFEAYTLIIANEAQKVQDDYADKDGFPKLSDFNEALSWSKKSIALASEKKFEPTDLWTTVFDDIYLQSDAPEQLLNNAQQAYDENTEMYLYLYYTGLAKCYLGKYNSSINDLENAFSQSLRDYKASEDQKIYSDSYTSTIFASLITSYVLRDQRLPDKFKMEYYEKSLGSCGLKNMLEKLNLLKSFNLNQIVEDAKDNSKGNIQTEASILKFKLFKMAQ